MTEICRGGLRSIDKRKAQLLQPPQLRKLRCALIFYFATFVEVALRTNAFKIRYRIIALRFHVF